jgi:hypothetical protein
VGASAVHGPAEQAPAQAARAAPVRPPRLDRMAGPADVLALQSAIGNRALARLAKSERRTLHRACCASCASGLPCEDELLDEHHPH